MLETLLVDEERRSAQGGAHVVDVHPLLHVRLREDVRDEERDVAPHRDCRSLPPDGIASRIGEERGEPTHHQVVPGKEAGYVVPVEPALVLGGARAASAGGHEGDEARAYRGQKNNDPDQRDHSTSQVLLVDHSLHDFEFPLHDEGQHPDRAEVDEGHRDGGEHRDAPHHLERELVHLRPQRPDLVQPLVRRPRPVGAGRAELRDLPRQAEDLLLCGLDEVASA
mmetsp:Transcript_10079/g.28379  ORF Transcript_10079/g.28379 Transcript_10079/m.28379 type:complete len:224 (-) Transcript_10079:254-925(-)